MIAGIGWNAARLSRRALALLFAVAAALVFTFGGVAPAHAEGDEYINSFKINYQVDTSGVLHVQEAIDYHFASLDHHGIERTLVTREPDPDTGKDIVYRISDFTASSPTESADVSTSTTGGPLSRDRSTTYRIGDPGSTISHEEVTYNLSYEVRGALRSSGSFDQLYWDATGSGWAVEIRNLQINAQVPGGAQEVACFAGAIGSNSTCDTSHVVDNNAVFGQGSVPAGQNVTIGVKIKSGLVSNNTPILVRPAGILTAITSPAVFIPGLIGLLITIGAPIFGRRIAKQRTTDLRYLNLAPGTVPLAGAPVEVGKSDPRLEIPVQFTPPPITVGEAGILVDGQVDIRDTAATLVSLAVNGAIKIEAVDGSGSGYQVRLLDPSRATGPHESAMLGKIFGGRPPGAVTDLSSRGSMTDAHKTLVSTTRNLVQQKQWFTKVPRAAGRALGGGWVGAVVIIGWILLHSGGGAGISPVLLLLLIPIASLVITTSMVSKIMRRGQRTPTGRAVCDHVDGFKQYLATAEAEQLRFEEGQDIFSRYLPWAIAFDLADRWQRICQQLVDMGRLPDRAPYWYGGPWSTFNAFNIGYMTGAFSTAATPAPSSGGSGFGGTGFGSGGSAFGGGGFSGGGGGGGGGGSW